MSKVNTIYNIIFLFLHAVTSVSSNYVNGTCYHTNGEPTDLFPNKVEVLHSKLWSVEYHKTYKLLTHHGTPKETYLLYQCGTSIPSLPDQSITQTISIPVSFVGIQSTTHIPFLELLGERTSIKASYASKQYISSPCLQEMITDEYTVIAEDFVTWQPPFVEGLNVSFINYGDAPLVNNPVKAMEYLESGTLAIAEYIKFFSVFFNMESRANFIFDEIIERYECVKDTASTYQFDLLQASRGSPKTIVWASYSNYVDWEGGHHLGWMIAKCNGPKFDGSTGPYYCEMAAAVGVELLNTTGRGSINVGGYDYYTDDEFLEFAKDADAFIYPSAYPTWKELHTEKYEMLNQIRAVRNDRVYDTQGQGANDWYESPYSEPSTMMEDFAYVTADTNENYLDKLVWFRKVDNEEDVVGSPGVCENVHDKRNVRESYDCLQYDIFDEFNVDGAAAVVKTSILTILVIWGGVDLLW
jgi:hypothetical protein